MEAMVKEGTQATGKLSDAELVELQGIARRCRFARDNSAFFEGDPSDAVYVILSGSVKVYTTAHDGQQKILRILGKGEIFGELAMVDGLPRSATVTCTAPTEMLIIPGHRFRKFAEAHPELLWRLVAALCERTRHASEELAWLAARDVPDRLHAALLQLARTHGETRADGCWIRMSLTLQDLASLVGSSGETVSRLLAQFESEGLLRLEQDAVHLPDLERLRQGLELASDWS